MSFVFVAGNLPAAQNNSASPTNQVRIIVVDAQTGKPFPARIHLKDQRGQPVQPPALPYHRGHFTCDGRAELRLPAGPYTYEAEHGPEYSLGSGAFTVTAGEPQEIRCSLRRFVDVAAEGWWAGDLHVHRPPEDIELLMRAEDLHVAPVITWWNKRNLWSNQPPAKPLVQFDRTRFYHLMAGEDEREGGALLYFQLPQPLPVKDAISREYPSPMHYLAQARAQRGAWVDVEKPFWWDAPTWLASGQMDSVGLAVNHMCRDQMYESEAWGRPRDTARLPPPRGNGFWTQEIYYHILNTGLRVPPSAGSASGVLPNPLGYNRVYVHTGKRLDWDTWWAGLRAGRSFVSNGPLLRCQADGQLPGHVFKGRAGRAVKIQLTARLDSRDPIPAFEIIKNGQIIRRVPFDDWRKTGQLGEIEFTESGWFLIRVITDVPHTFRFASTAPYHVEIGETPHRISRASAQFFLDWTRERMQRIKLDDAGQKAAVLEPHLRAEQFWQARVAQANVE